MLKNNLKLFFNNKSYFYFTVFSGIIGHIVFIFSIIYYFLNILLLRDFNIN